MNWKRILKWTGITVGALLGFVVLFIGFQLWGFGRAGARGYDVPPPDGAASDDSVVIARGQHLAEATGGCQTCAGQGRGGRRGARATRGGERDNVTKTGGGRRTMNRREPSRAPMADGWKHGSHRA